MSINWDNYLMSTATYTSAYYPPPKRYRTDFDDKAEWEKFQQDHPLSSYKKPAGFSGRASVQMQYQRQAFELYTITETGRNPYWCGHCGTNIGTTITGSYRICDTCAALYKNCGTCGILRHDFTEVEGVAYCHRCMAKLFAWCERCSVWIRRADAEAMEQHDHSRRNCTCEAQAQQFRIRNDGQPLLENDTRVTIQLPGGTISAMGIQHMADKLYRYGYYEASGLVQGMDPQWQTTEGNFTKRLSKALYKNSGGKLSATILAELGTIAADYSGKPVDLSVETTRRLNLNVHESGNPSSCWWGGFSYSRCTLKTLGGFGIRTFRENLEGPCLRCGFMRCSHNRSGAFVAGRVWVIPLRKGAGSALVATRETENCLAYVVFNGYGQLAGYTGPRLLAHMVGMSYKKVSFTVGGERMSINSSSAYLVGPQDLLSKRRAIALAAVKDEHVNPYD